MCNTVFRLHVPFSHKLDFQLETQIHMFKGFWTSSCNVMRLTFPDLKLPKESCEYQFGVLWDFGDVEQWFWRYQTYEWFFTDSRKYRSVVDKNSYSQYCGLMVIKRWKFFDKPLSPLINYSISLKLKKKKAKKKFKVGTVLWTAGHEDTQFFMA